MTKNKPQTESKHKPVPKYSLEVLWKFPNLVKWLNQISRRGNFDDFFYISDYKEKEKVRLKVFTKDHQYSISVRLPSENNDGYLSCIAQTRRARAGEDWNRGNDLANGSYSEKTWQEIKDDILAYELVKVVRNSADKDEK